MNKILSFFVVFGILLSFVGCNRTYMTIEGTKISMAQFNKEKKFVFPPSENSKEQLDGYMAEQQNYEVEQRLVFKTIAKRLAAENEVALDEAELAQYVAFYANCGQKIPDLDIADYIFKVRFNKSFDLLKDDASTNGLVYKIFKKQLGENKKEPTEEEIEKVYTEQIEYFKIPEAYLAIKMSIAKSKKTEKDPEAADWTLEEVEAIKASINSEKSFVKAIKKYSKFEENNKNLFYIGQGDENVDKAFANVEDNSITAVQDNGAYFVCYWVIKKYPARTVDKAEVLIPLDDYLYVMNNQEAFKEFNTVFNTQDVVYNEKERVQAKLQAKEAKKAAKAAKDAAKVAEEAAEVAEEIEEVITETAEIETELSDDVATQHVHDENCKH